MNVQSPRRTGTGQGCAGVCRSMDSAPSRSECSTRHRHGVELAGHLGENSSPLATPDQLEISIRYRCHETSISALCWPSGLLFGDLKAEVSARADAHERKKGRTEFWHSQALVDPDTEQENPNTNVQTRI